MPVHRGSGDVDDPEKTKIYPVTYMLGYAGPVPYKDDYMALDITDLLPIENKQVFLQVFDDSGNYQTGTLKEFSIESYDVYDKTGSNYSSKYSSTDLPKTTINGSKIASVISNVNISAAEQREKSDDSRFISEKLTRKNLWENKSIENENKIIRLRVNLI